jgi:tetratricopeptide (TPR) repeat protein
MSAKRAHKAELRRDPRKSAPEHRAAGRSGAIAAGFLLALITFVAYLPAIECDFIWDDDACVQRNQVLRERDGLWRFWYEDGAMPYQYYPMVYTTYWIEHQLWGLDPTGYHLVNIILHVISVVLLWRILAFLKVPGGWLIAAVFAIHPLQVESVAWVTERKNVLSGTLYFASALAYLRFALLDAKQPKRHGSWWLYGWALALFLLALLSKTAVCTLPAALMLVLWWKHGRIGLRDVLFLTPLFVMGVGLGLLTAWMEADPGHVAASGGDWDHSLVEHFLIAGRAVWFYAGKLFWPATLIFVYPRWQIDAGAWWQYVYPAAALAVMAGLWFTRHRIGRGPLVAVLYFVGTLFPALGFFNVYYMQFSFVADHWQYLACIGLIALVVGAVTTVSEPSTGRSRFALPIAVVVILAILGTLTWRQQGMYRNIDALWQETLRKNPDAWLVHNNVGARLKQQGETDRAIHHYREAIRAKPAFADAHNNLAIALQEQGQVAEAVEHFQRAVEGRPESARIHNNLAGALRSQNRIDEAVHHFREALRLRPDQPIAHYNLALTLMLTGPYDEMLHHFREAVRLKPDWSIALRQLARILATQPDSTVAELEEARQLAERAVELTQRQDPRALDTLAIAYAAAGDFEAAIKTAEAAITQATAAAQEPLANQIRQRLSSYQQRERYEESWRLRR